MFFDPITDFFAVLIFSIFILSGRTIFLKQTAQGNNLIKSAPTLLTSLGILGTFVGIIFSLLDFNTSDLDSSIPQLLEGMKIAFLTSIFGMSTSILLKFFSIWMDKEDEVSDRNFFKEQIARQTLAIEKFEIILMQENKHRTDQLDKLIDALSDSLVNFTGNLSISLTKEIVDALEKVVIDFNDNLVHQFGENFKYLDSSVKELLVWQGNYKSLLTNISGQYDLNARALNEMRDAIADMVYSLEKLPSLMNDFNQVIKFNHRQIGHIGDQMTAFSEIKEKAINSFPDIENYFQKITTEIKETTDLFNKILKEQVIKISRDMTNLSSQTTTELAMNIEHIKLINQELGKSLKASSLVMESTIKSVSEIFESQLSSFEHTFDKKLSQAMDKQIIELKQLGEVINKENSQLILEFQNSIKEIKPNRDNNGGFLKNLLGK